MLTELHAFAALATSTPELMLDEEKDEHKKLARALARVADHYDISGYVAMPTHPLFGLARCCAALYIPRLIAIKMRQAAERAERAKDITPRAGLAPPPQRAPEPQPMPPPPPQPTRTAPAPPPPPQTPRTPPVAPTTMQGNPNVVRAAPIPGFENIVLNIDTSKLN